MTQYKWTARFSNTVFASALAAAETARKVDRSDFSVMLRPTTSGIRWSHGAWCLYHEAIVDVDPPYIDEFEIIGMMGVDGTMRALPGTKPEDLPIAPIVVRVDGDICRMTTEGLIRHTSRASLVQGRVRYAEALLTFVSTVDSLAQDENDESLFSAGPVANVFLIACIVRYTRDLYAVVEANDNGYEPPEADQIAHSFIHDPWSELTDVHPKGEDYMVAGAFMAHLFEMDERKGWMPRLSDVQSPEQLENMAAYAVSFYTRDLEQIR